VVLKSFSTHLFSLVEIIGSSKKVRFQYLPQLFIESEQKRRQLALLGNAEAK
jgi:hypothetical protein